MARVVSVDLLHIVASAQMLQGRTIDAVIGTVVGRSLSPFVAVFLALMVVGGTVACVFTYRRFWKKQTLASASATG